MFLSHKFIESHYFHVILYIYIYIYIFLLLELQKLYQFELIII